MDINNVICNISSSDDQAIKLEVELDDESNFISEDEVLDTSLFQFFMAQSLPQALPVEDKITKQVVIETADETSVIEQMNSEVSSLSLNNQEPIQNYSEIKNFENNIAIAWIDSESFQQNIQNPLKELPIATKAIEFNNADLPSAVAQHVINNDNYEIEEAFSDNYNDNYIADYIADYTELPSPTEKQAFDYSMLLSSSVSDNLLKPEIKKIEAPYVSNKSLLDSITPDFNINPMDYSQNAVIDKQTTTGILAAEKTLDFNNSDWADQFSDQIIWMGRQNIKSAIIKVNPEELGALEINVEVTNDKAHVNIASNSEQVRALLEDALPKLKEMMLEQGFSATDVFVGADTNSQGFKQNNENAEYSSNELDQELLSTPLSKKSSNGLVDYFA